MKANLTVLLFALCSSNIFSQEQFDAKPPKGEVETRPVKWERPAKGSYVFIKCDNQQEERILPHLIDRIDRWGYWHVVTAKDSADFFLEQVMRDKELPTMKGYVILKRKDGSEIARTEVMTADGAPHNGFSQWRAFSIKVGRWLKGEKE